MTSHLSTRPLACVRFLALAGLACCAFPHGARAAGAQKAEANRVAQITLVSKKTYSNPFQEVDLDAVVTRPDGSQLRVPAYWAGGSRWCFRYASDQPGQHAWRTECSDKTNAKLHGVEGRIKVVPCRGENPLYRHGPVQVAKDGRHFEHSDGTPFFWLGDTWWKGLSKRLPFEGFQKLTADRKAKGFSVVQIIAGPYPDEPPFDPRWENEGGMPYEKDYVRINPAYFDQADRRIAHLADAGLMPAIVGGWGWHLPAVGVEKMSRHWRYLIARYGAYPVAWIIGGEAGGPQWTEVARYVRNTDPYRRPATMHPYPGAGRKHVTDETVLTFDMVQTGHGGFFGADSPYGVWQATAANTVSKVMASYSKTPPMPVVVGEVVYEAHMMTNGPDVQRQVFWSALLSGAAGHTYGAGGLWQMNSETERGAEYEFTPWSEAMALPGATQLGLAKTLLEEYAWWRFQPHPEWVEPRSVALLEPHEEWFDDDQRFAARGGRWDLPYAAGIPGEVRVIFIPGHYYNWAAPTIKELERDVPYHAFLFNPASGKRYALGTVVNAGPPPKPFEGHAKPLLFADTFDGADGSGWKDYGSPSQRRDGRLVCGKGLVTVLEKLADTNLMVSADATSDAEAGLVLRFQDADNYLVALYSPSLKAIFLHDRKNGQYGAPLGKVDVPEIGPKIHLTAAVSGKHAALVLTDGQKTYCTPSVEVSNIAAGKTGVWIFQIGDRQEFDNFEVSKTQFAPVKRELDGLPVTPGAAKESPLVMHENPHILPAVKLPEVTFLPGGDYKLPRLPSPQDWVVVLARVKAAAAAKAPLPPSPAPSTALVADWVYQAEARPLAERSRQELGWARELAARLAKDPRTPDLSAELSELDVLAGKAATNNPALDGDAARELYLAVRQVKRSILFKNPAVDFTQLLLIDQPLPQGSESTHEAVHRLGMMAAPGGRLLVLDGLRPDGAVRQLAPDKPGSFWRPELSFDAKKVLFCHKPKDGKSFHLYEMNVDGSGLKQLTDSDYDDIDPIYLPDGHILFTSTRGNTYVRCGPYIYSYVLARCDADGRNIYLVSMNSEPDFVPSLLNDGRVVYSRWEYSDKDQNRVQGLWTTRQDGTQTAVLWGNQSVWPDHLAEPRPMPGSGRVMFTSVGHHDWFHGSIGLIDPAKGFNFPHGLTRATFDLPWAEVGNSPADRPEAPDYHASGPFTGYMAPYPLSGEDFLVSARGAADKFRIYLMDVHGNRELIYEGLHNAWYAMPVKPRPVPPAQPDLVTWPGTGKERKPVSPGVFYSGDVCQGVPGLPRERVKYLRVVQQDAKTYSSWQKNFAFSGPAVSAVQTEAVKRIVSTVPVEADGSVYFEAPAGQAFFFQLLDENYLALHTMRSFTGLMPGERRGCGGCHSLHSVAPPSEPGVASRRAPTPLTPPPWGAETIGYERFVQPVLDHYCGKCHQGEGKARKKLNLTLRPASEAFPHFKEPYLTLIGPAAWPVAVPNPGQAGYGIAGAIPVYGLKPDDVYPNDPATDGPSTIQRSLRPLRFLSARSPLIELAMSGKHHDVKVGPAGLLRLIAWVDANCPYLGEEEIRAMADPEFNGIDKLPIRPRLKTAPVIERP